MRNLEVALSRMGEQRVALWGIYRDFASEIHTASGGGVNLLCSRDNSATLCAAGT